MLTLRFEEEEYFDPKSKRIITVPAAQMELEHSLVSLSKWESIHQKPFLDQKEKTQEELFSYVECMCLGDFPPGGFRHRFRDEHVQQIADYLERDHTATTFTTRKQRPGRPQIVTSELIYYWMLSCGISLEAETWNLSRLLTLIRTFEVKNSNEKMSRQEVAKSYREENERRLREYNTTG